MREIYFRKDPEKLRNKLRHPLVIGGIEYKSIKEAAGKLNCSTGLISLSLKRGQFRGLEIRRLKKGDKETIKGEWHD